MTDRQTIATMPAAELVRELLHAGLVTEQTIATVITRRDDLTDATDVDVTIYDGGTVALAYRTS